MSNFSAYMLGALLVAGGLAYGAYIAGAPPVWIFVGVVIIIGFGIMGGVQKTKRKEKSDTDD